MACLFIFIFAACLLCVRAGITTLSGDSHSATRLQFSDVNTVPGPRTFISIERAGLGCGDALALFVKNAVQEANANLTNADLLNASSASVLIVFDGHLEFTEPCSLEDRVRISQESGAHGALFATQLAGVMPNPMFLPYDGTFGSGYKSSLIIPAGVVDRAFLEAAEFQESEGPVEIQGFLLDEDPSMDAWRSPGMLTVFALGVVMGTIPAFSAASQLVERAKARKNLRGTAKSRNEFGVRDCVYVGQLVQFVLNFMNFGSSIAIMAHFAYPLGLPAAGGLLGWAQTIGMFLAQPVNNLNFLLVVAAWADALEMTGGAKKGLFKSEKVRRFFLVVNVGAFFLEFVHIPTFMLRSPLDNVIGQLVNVVTILLITGQGFGFLFYGRKLIKTLNAGVKKKGQASDADRRLVRTVQRMSKLITGLAVMLLLCFFSGGFVVGMMAVGQLTTEGFVYFFMMPQVFARTCALYLYVAIVTPPRAANKRKTGAVTPSVASSAADSTCASTTCDSSTMNSTAGGSTTAATSVGKSSVNASSANA